MSTLHFYFQRAFSTLKVGDMAVNFKLEGLDQVQSKLDLLANPKKAKSIARKAARQAMNIARDV